MSTKSTIILTDQNEHWYFDCMAKSNNTAREDEAFFLEFSNEHQLEKTEDGFEVTVNKGSKLYNELKEMFRGV